MYSGVLTATKHTANQRFNILVKLIGLQHTNRLDMMMNVTNQKSLRHNAEEGVAVAPKRTPSAPFIRQQRARATECLVSGYRSRGSQDTQSTLGVQRPFSCHNSHVWSKEIVNVNCSIN